MTHRRDPETRRTYRADERETREDATRGCAAAVAALILVCWLVGCLVEGLMDGAWWANAAAWSLVVAVSVGIVAGMKGDPK